MRRRHLLSTFALALCATLWTTQGHAVLLAGWTFETSVPTSAGPHAAELGLNAGVGSPATGFHAGTTVYSNPAGNGSAESFSSTGWTTVSDYYQFRTSTVGYQSISFSWHQTRSSTGPATFDLQYSTDGSTFTTLTNDYAVGTATWSSMGVPNPASIFAAVTGPAGLDNQASVYFRLKSEVVAAAGGTNRVDNAMIEGTEIPAAIPEPSTLLLVGLGGLLVCLKRLT